MKKNKNRKMNKENREKVIQCKNRRDCFSGKKDIESLRRRKAEKKNSSWNNFNKS